MCTMIWSVRWYSTLRIARRTSPPLPVAGDALCPPGFGAAVVEDAGFSSCANAVASANEAKKIKTDRTITGRRGIARLRGAAFNFEKGRERSPQAGLRASDGSLRREICRRW